MNGSISSTPPYILEPCKYGGTNEEDDLRAGLEKVVGGTGIMGPESDNFNKGEKEYFHSAVIQ